MRSNLAMGVALGSAILRRGGASAALPTFTTQPSIIGARVVGQTLVGSAGAQTGTLPITLAYAWLANGVAISGETGITYTQVVGDVGKTIEFRVTPTNAAGTGAAATTTGSTATIAVPTIVYGPAVMDSGSTDWGGTTFIHRLTAADMLAGTGTKMRITTRLDAWTSGGTMKGYIGQAAASGDVYDFLGTPAQITWGGSSTFTSTGINLEQISDPITLPETYDETKDYLFVFYFSSVAAVTFDGGASNAIAGGSYYKSGDDAATVNKTGYTSFSPLKVLLVSKIEVASAFDVTALRNVLAETMALALGGRTNVAHSDATKASSIQVSYDGKREAFTLQNGSLYAGDSARADPKPNRAELSGHLAPFAVASTVWAAFSFKLDPTSADVPYALIFQFHQREESGDALANPAFEMQLVGTAYGKTRELSMVTRGSTVSPIKAYGTAPDLADWNAVTRWTMPTPLGLGDVHNVVLSLKHGPSTNGNLGAWFDGVQVHNPATSIQFGFASTLVHYDKRGLYDDNAATTRVLRYFNFEIGTADLSARILAPLAIT